MPYSLDNKDESVKELTLPKNKYVGLHNLAAAKLQSDLATFRTKTFFVRYAEEIVIFRDIVRFRTDVDTAVLNYTELPFFVKIELFWLPLTTRLTGNLMDSPEMQAYLDNSNSDDFLMVQSRTMQLNRSMMGISTYVPVHFDHEFTCLTSFTVHGSLVQFKYRPRAAAEDASSTRVVPLSTAPIQETADEPLKLHKFLFHGLPEAQIPDQISRVLFEISGILVEAHSQMQRHFRNIVARAVADREKLHIDFSLDVPDIKVPPTIVLEKLIENSLSTTGPSLFEQSGFVRFEEVKQGTDEQQLPRNHMVLQRNVFKPQKLIEISVKRSNLLKNANRIVSMN